MDTTEKFRRHFVGEQVGWLDGGNAVVIGVKGDEVTVHAEDGNEFRIIAVAKPLR